jgi:5'-3' exonuclease
MTSSPSRRGVFIPVYRTVRKVKIIMRYVFIDGNYICNLALHSKTGELRNGALYGALKQFKSYVKKFGGPDTRFVWAWDQTHSGVNYRRDIFPDYKKSRRDKAKKQADGLDTEAEHGWDAVRRDFYRQIDILKHLVVEHSVLGGAVSRLGFEGDDIIAALVKTVLRQQADCSEQPEIILIANDEDLFQLLTTGVAGSEIGGTVWMYRPSLDTGTSRRARANKGLDPESGPYYHLADFQAEWKLRVNGLGFGCNEHGAPEPDSAKLWAVVRAIAGCTTDGIPGIPGIGAASAVKYLNGYASDKIVDKICLPENQVLLQRNLKLVTLPFSLGYLSPDFKGKSNEARLPLTAKNELLSLEGREQLLAQINASEVQESSASAESWKKIAMNYEMPSLAK